MYSLFVYILNEFLYFLNSYIIILSDLQSFSELEHTIHSGHAVVCIHFYRAMLAQSAVMRQ